MRKKGKGNSSGKNNKQSTAYIKLSNAYASLPHFNDPISKDPPTIRAAAVPANTATKIKASHYQSKVARRQQAKSILRRQQSDEDAFFDDSITLAEDERTVYAKGDTTNKKRATIDEAHVPAAKPSMSFLQRGRNAGYSMGTSIRRAISQLRPDTPRVRFATTKRVRQFHGEAAAVMITYDSGADGHYISEKDRQQARLPILRQSSKRVGLANGGVSTAKHVTRLPFEQLSAEAGTADTFEDFPSSLMSVGKTSDDGTISIFTKDGVTVHKEEDVLITCQGAPILIGVRDERGRYRIPLIQHRNGNWQPRKPSKRARKVLSQANSVYDLPSTEQAIKWMHAVCGYPVKSTWLKAVKAGNYVGWPLLSEKNVRKYYPETTETPKGHMNQTRKNVRSTKSKITPSATVESSQSSDSKRGTRGTRIIAARFPMAEPDITQLRGKKVRDVYVKVYDVRGTIFFDQTGWFPTR